MLLIQMVLELLFLFFLIIGLCAFAYRGAIHEFQILQKDYDGENNWSELLSEELPLVIRGIPKSWSGGWNAKTTAKKTWQVIVRHDGRRFKTNWSAWLATPYPKPQPNNIQEIAAVARLDHTISNWAADGLRRWSWLPPSTPQPYVFGGTDYIGVKKLAAEYTVITATDGAPLELWIAHEGAIPSNVCSDLLGKNPWIQSSETIPWIGEVKYIEMKLRHGNAVLIPKHWWLSIRVTQEANNVAAWFWIAEFNTPISWIASLVKTESKTATL
jgi:hypothetical protein